jgi:hypothetical protein
LAAATSTTSTSRCSRGETCRRSVRGPSKSTRGVAQ